MDPGTLPGVQELSVWGYKARSHETMCVGIRATNIITHSNVISLVSRTPICIALCVALTESHTLPKLTN